MPLPEQSVMPQNPTELLASRVTSANITAWIVTPLNQSISEIKPAIEVIDKTLSNIELETAKIRSGNEVFLYGQEIEDVS